MNSDRRVLSHLRLSTVADRPFRPDPRVRSTLPTSAVRPQDMQLSVRALPHRSDQAMVRPWGGEGTRCWMSLAVKGSAPLVRPT